MNTTMARGLAAAALMLPLAAAAQTRWLGDEVSGAVALRAINGPDYLGSVDRGWTLRPGLYLRWGRYSLSSGGGWAARRGDDTPGFGIDFGHSDNFDFKFGLRADRGRNESGSPAFRGLGDVRQTIRARLGAEWRFAPDWAWINAATIDALGRGGGVLFESKFRHIAELSHNLSVETAFALAAGDRRYMQSYFGVTHEQSQSSQYLKYIASVSLRDASVSSTLRWDINDQWVTLVGAGYTRVLGDAAHSPLTGRVGSWNATLGVGYRF